MKMQKQWLKRRTWLEEQALLYITWTGNARILNMSQSQCGQTHLDMCNFVNMPEYARNITCLNKPEISESAQITFKICMNCSWVVP